MFYRLNVLTLVIPPLRERKEDIHELAREFWCNYSKMQKNNLANDAIEALQEYMWPGNIRQLKNFIEKLSIINTSDLINAHIINRMISNYEPNFEEKKELKYSRSKPHITKEEIEEVLQFTKGNKTKAANNLGIHRSTLWRLIKKYDI